MVFVIKRHINREDPYTTLTVQDLKDWEEKNGRFPDHSVILLYTGQSKFYNDVDKFYVNYTGFSPEAAQWLVDER